MLTSIPVTALELGIDFQGYEELARNIARMNCISERARQERINQANTELSERTKVLALQLIQEMAEDREVYQFAELKYWRGPPEGKALFSSAVADYLLRHKQLLEPQ
jgi:hypothetical protein